MFHENFWFFTFDIESGYFVFRVLPFGLSSACYLFTLVGDPLVFLLLCILMMESLPADRYYMLSPLVN